MTKAIVVDYDLSAPPEKVWRTLTEPALVSRWLMETDIAPVIGHRFTFRSKPMPGWDGLVTCEILACDAPRLLRYSWRGGSGVNALDTLVTWTLERTDAGGTRLHLEHSGFTDANEVAWAGMSRGWQKMGERLDPIAAEL